MGYCRKCNKEKPDNEMVQWPARWKDKRYAKYVCADCHSKDSSRRTMAISKIDKHNAFIAYGGYRCACCGEIEPLFLSIDHINHNGSAMRKVHGKGPNFYRWLRKNNYPAGFQILCMNCQHAQSRQMRQGDPVICPHQLTSNDYPEREYAQASGSAAVPKYPYSDLTVI